ncbi:hypothetical protein LJC20_01930 [Eubacteriales bacterium OttesenSCG-928-M02]|nr:hypothetical protein [Eubacteriales bacterium OttesenSCG-928-M02]
MPRYARYVFLFGQRQEAVQAGKARPTAIKSKCRLCIAGIWMEEQKAVRTLLLTIPLYQ